MTRARLLGLALLLATLPAWFLAPRMLLASWLAAWWWALGVVLGCFVNAWVNALSGGRWGVPIRQAALSLGRHMRWLVPGLALVALAMQRLYPWAMHSAAWSEQAARSGFVRAWLSPPFFLVRLGFYALAWSWETRASSFTSAGRAAASLGVHAIVTSLASIDIVMSLMPQWYSTAFGLVVMSMQALAGMAAGTLFHAARAETHDGAPTAPLSRDLGNLLLTWCMCWGYVAFMQFLVIWSENLPREIAWYVPRLQTGWRWVGVALLLVPLGLPLLALLFRAVKDRPDRLGAVALVVLAGSALDATWLVLPSVDPHDLNGWWLAPLAFAGIALLLIDVHMARDALTQRAGRHHA